MRRVTSDLRQAVREAARRGGGAARRHWLFTSVLIVGIALRIAVQIAYWPALLYIDSVRYLYAESTWDPLGYLVMLWPLLRVGGLALVAVGQHVLGLSIAVTIYAIALRRGAKRWAGVLAAAPVLLDAYQLQLEQNIMADTLFQAAVVAGLAALLWNWRPRLRAVAVAGLAFGLAAIVREVGVLLLVPAAAYVWLTTRRYRPRRLPRRIPAGRGRRLWAACRNRAIRSRPLTGLALLGVSFALPITGYLLVNLTFTGRMDLSSQGSSLYGRAAAAADCATLRLPSYESALCPTPAVARALGVDGLLHDVNSPALTYRAPPGMRAGKIRGDFTRRVFVQQPAAVTSAITRDFMESFRYPRTPGHADTPLLRWQFQTRYPAFPPGLPRSRETLIMAQFGGGRPAVVRPLATMLRAYQVHGGYTPGPALLLAGLAGIAGAARWRHRRRRGKGHAAPRVIAVDPAYRGMRAACFLLAATGFVLLTSADVIEFSWRYQQPGLVTLPLAGALGIACLRSRWRRTTRVAQSRLTARPVPRPGVELDTLTMASASARHHATGDAKAQAYHNQHNPDVAQGLSGARRLQGAQAPK